jgi:glycosyltransferase involved in cell wall biosynthesis
MTVRAVSSALRDCRPEDELIVVDDGSTDSTEQALQQFGTRILYFRVPHGGAGKARNFGVKQAKNPLVAFLDSDDEWLPGKVELKRALMQARPDLVFCCSDFASVDDEGHLIHNSLIYWHKDQRSWDEILGKGIPLSQLAVLPQELDDCTVHIGSLYRPEMLGSYVATTTVVVRKETAGDALFFAEDLPTYEDWLCFGQLARIGLCAYLNCETGLQHRHTGPRVTDANALACATTSIAILERVWGRDPNFVYAYGSEYQKALRKQRLRRVRALLSSGNTREARGEMTRLRPAPIPFKVMSYCPAPLLKAAIATRRAIRERLSRSEAA